MGENVLQNIIGESVDEFTMIKFYRMPLLDICESQHGRPYEGFSHVEKSPSP